MADGVYRVDYCIRNMMTGTQTLGGWSVCQM